MKEINLNKESKTAKWYKFFWCTELPSNTCIFYKNIILSWILTPITFPGFVLHKELNSPLSRSIFTFIIALLPLYFGFIFYGETYKEKNRFVIWLTGLCGIILVSAAMALIGFIIIGSINLYEYLIKTKSSEPGVIKSYFKQLKEKTCNKINWI